MAKISVCILSKNAEKTIQKTLQSVTAFDEIILIDDNSTDQTLKIAKKYKAKIYSRELNNDFSAQRNFALTKTSNNWVLFLDSDEYLSESLIKLINSLDFNTNGYYIKREEIWMGKSLKGGEWSNTYLLRLANKTKGKWMRAVHEYWDISETKNISAPIIHNPNQTLSEFIAKINYYAKLHLVEHKKSGKKSSFFKVIFYPILKFINNFFIKKGFLDGVHGFVYSILMSAHSFFVWSQLWIDSQKK